MGQDIKQQGFKQVDNKTWENQDQSNKAIDSN